MDLAHICDNGKVRLHHLAHVADLTEMVHARLDDGSLMALLQRQQRQGCADIVVEIGLGLMGAEPPGQHRRDHFLGGGLAGGAGDLHEGDAEPLPVPGGQGLQRGLGILHQHVALAGAHRLGTAGRQACLGPLLQSACNIVVTVEPLPHQGDKKLSRRGGTAVGGDGGDYRLRILQHHAAHGGADLTQCTTQHQNPAFLAFSDSITIRSQSSG